MPPQAPGQGAKTAQMATGITSVGLTTVGTIMAATLGGTALGGPIGAAVAGVGAIVGILAGIINPAKSAIRGELEAQGFSKAFAKEYAKIIQLSDAQLQTRMVQAGTQYTRSGNLSDLEQMQAIRVVWTQRRKNEYEQALALTPPQEPAIPTWAPLALFAMMAVGSALLLARPKRGRR